MTADTKTAIVPRAVTGTDYSASVGPGSIISGVGSGSFEGPQHKLVGGRRRSHRRSHRKHRGGSMLETALVPFGLFGLQKYFSKSRSNPLKRMGRSARRTIKRVF
jgi:hypothetical protein